MSYAKKLLVVYLKFKSNQVFLILSGNPNWGGQWSKKFRWVLLAARGCCSVVASLSGPTALCPLLQSLRTR